MGRKRKKLVDMDKSEQEVLAEEVRKYPSLYDPSHPFYRDLKQKDRAWKLVTVALGYEEGEAFKQFDLLRSRYRDKQAEWLKRTTTDSLAVDTAEENEGENQEEEEKEYKFLTWLQPYINIPADDDVIEFFPHPKDVDESDAVDVRSDDSDSADSDQDSDQEDYYPPLPEKNDSIGSLNTDITTSPEQTSNGKRRYTWKHIENTSRHNKRKAIAQFQSSEFVPNTFNTLNHPLLNATNQDDIFGHMIAGELKTLPQHAKVQVKYDIQNILYRHQMVQLQHMQKLNMQGHHHTPFGMPQHNRGVSTFSKDSTVALEHSKASFDGPSEDELESKKIKLEPP